MIFNDVTPAQLAELAVKVKELSGVDIAGDVGVYDQEDWKISWCYTPNTCSLTINVYKTPWNKPKFMVENKITQIVQEVGA